MARRWAVRLLPILLLALAGWVMWREFRHTDPARILDDIDHWGWGRLAFAGLMTLVSFGLLAVMEWLGLRWAGAKVPFLAVLLGSFCANGIAHVTGTAVLVAGAVRYRLYARHGADLAQVAETTVFCIVGYSIGITELVGLSLLTAPDLGGAALRLSPLLTRSLGLALALAPFVYVLACAGVRAPLRLLGREYRLPSVRVALAQLAIGLVDNVAVAAVIWVLIPPGLVSFPAFSAAYAAATVTGVASSVPAGAGVFESAILTLLPALPRDVLAAAFVGNRIIYYLGPLLISAAILAQAGMMPGLKRRDD
ncbi:uncharacterized membrane protein YbhN (UPF0104 family) [Caulobacter ginsengisoli]|uniref:Uncharacterized membrane protein YbhN (UPF0104 family) n=1 Tax=Caulobacter ginsengisoli TaxID=400775 RepID=A0ABU0IV02_9CAUL|nr:YbhN family protein [Caulobacter ginsengisoli]MDQ0465850.1 uncharacterized membrane protein YbhN (UPF0104 family) [Caulobacter ginsengisoli]